MTDGEAPERALKQAEIVRDLAAAVFDDPEAFWEYDEEARGYILKPPRPSIYLFQWESGRWGIESPLSDVAMVVTVDKAESLERALRGLLAALDAFRVGSGAP